MSKCAKAIIFLMYCPFFTVPLTANKSSHIERERSACVCISEGLSYMSVHPHMMVTNY